MSASFGGDPSLLIPSVLGGGLEGVGSDSRSMLTSLDLSNSDPTLELASFVSIFEDTPPTTLMTSLLQLSRLLLLPLTVAVVLEREATCGCGFKEDSFEVDVGPANLESFGLERELPLGGIGRLEAEGIFFKGATNFEEEVLLFVGDGSCSSSLAAVVEG